MKQKKRNLIAQQNSLLNTSGSNSQSKRKAQSSKIGYPSLKKNNYKREIKHLGHTITDLLTKINIIKEL